MLSLKEKVLTHAFDCFKARTAFIISQKHHIVEKDGLKFQFNFYDRSVYTGDHPPREESKDPLLPPYPPHILATHLQNGAAHNIQINLYSFKPGHVVISSDNPSDRQGDPLNDTDFHAFSQFLLDFGNKGIGYYNSGNESGCSQLHKHIQYIPTEDFPIADVMSKGKNLPWLYYSKKIEWFSPECVKDAWNDLTSRMKSGKFGDDIKHFNFVLTKHHAFLVPRKQARHRLGITLNSLGVCGQFFTYEEKFESMKDHPIDIVRDLCYAI
ncbi:hypothetical protein TVAG_456830 [Trichomonas vaginalis G3]|uniref:Uncharacterized protein n=1 Tax=Trichomonas vaginalis (strain ATCC PRA-98 / G3) TaxID=412133 RepID=A2DC07_TRIV3|nr:ATP adenylyltransferase family [Trichomonas vaginalis G3]EAY22048.1 hypothetical protein TVAG_456830 [Trichomonas vaginalis G3]KAI5525325.1 ATP adenylyltransferase family [Trichomonas vaginalis G3]|eukprot:XP_001583034.1 hypothetical protein [Trichomonas vaginalis G3]